MQEERLIHTLLRGALAASLLASTCAQSIVSDRHLQGVSALECQLESSPAEFRLLVNVKDRTLQLEKAAAKIPYQDISESKLRFRLLLPGAPERSCELELPAGSLVCAQLDGNLAFGFCLTVQ